MAGTIRRTPGTPPPRRTATSCGWSSAATSPNSAGSCTTSPG